MIADGVSYDAWTFDGRVPGPVLRVTEGDTVEFTLVNQAPMPHSLDFHAAEIAPSRAYVNLMRSEEHTSELQSPYDLVCRLLLEKKNINNQFTAMPNKTALYQPHHIISR